jgi:hypothetical protein
MEWIRDLFSEKVVPLLLVQDAFLEDDDLRAQLGILSGELLVLEAEVRGRLLGHDGLLLLPPLLLHSETESEDSVVGGGRNAVSVVDP